MQIHNMNQNIVVSVGSDHVKKSTMRDFLSWGDIGTVYIYNFMKYTEECQELAGGSCSGFQIVLIHSLALVTSFYYTIFFC